MKKSVFFLLLVASCVFAAAFITKVIPLNYIGADVAVQALEPLLKPGESMSHTSHQLIVNASPETITTLSSVLQQLDVPPVVFNVFVHQGEANWLSNNQSNDVVYTTSTQSNAANNQSVQVVSGASAFIAMGSNVPVVSSVSGGFWNQGVSYQRMNAQQGLLVEPQLHGGRVTLKIRRINNKMNNTNSQEMDSQSVDTTTIVPLDQWVKLGSSGQADNETPSSDTVYGTTGNYENNTTLFIKVSLVK